MDAIGSVLARLHAWVAVGAAVIAVIVTLAGVLEGLGSGPSRRWLDRLLVALLVAVGAAVLLGPGIVIGVGPPSEPIHYLYAVIAIAAVPAARYAAHRRAAGRIGWWLALGGLVTLAAIVRLWQTGS